MDSHRKTRLVVTKAVCEKKRHFTHYCPFQPPSRSLLTSQSSMNLTYSRLWRRSLSTRLKSTLSGCCRRRLPKLPVESARPPSR